MRGAWFARRTIEVDCTVEIEQTRESFRAYAVPEGIALQPGDTVLVHGAPRIVRFGDNYVVPSRATVTRANWLERAWTRFAAMFELSELYEVGFAPKDEIVLRAVKPYG